MEEEGFYDSLDETPESESTCHSPESSFVNCNAETDQEGEQKSKEESDVCSLIPLYTGEVTKPPETRRQKRRTTRILLPVPEKPRCADSYLAIFHSRIGYPSDVTKKGCAPESVRAVDGDLTKRTVDSQESAAPELFEDAQDAASDTESFYQNLILNHDERTTKGTKSLNTRRSVTTTSLTNSTCTELHSVSEQALWSPQSGRRKIRKRLVIPEPVVGRLGPDMQAMKDKLENWKRRQNYGLAASEKNRIRLREWKVLKELETEATQGKETQET